MKKKIISLVLAVVMATGVVASSSATFTAAKKQSQKITVKKTSYSKSPSSKNFKLGAKAMTKLTYKSSNKKVASVSKKGVVNVKKVGKTTITIKAKATAKYKSATKKVKVYVGKITCNSYKIKGSNDTSMYSNGVVSVFKNYYNYPVDITATCVYYDSNGNMMETKNDYLYVLGSKQSAVATFMAPYDNGYLDFASYKVSYTFKDKNSSSYSYKYTSLQSKIKVTSNYNSSSDGVIAEVKNTSKKDLKSYKAQLLILYYDSNKNVIGYDTDYPNVTSAGSTDYVEFSFPYASNYLTHVTPNSYKIFVNEAYTYTTS